MDCIFLRNKEKLVWQNIVVVVIVIEELMIVSTLTTYGERYLFQCQSARQYPVAPPLPCSAETPTGRNLDIES